MRIKNRFNIIQLLFFSLFLVVFTSCSTVNWKIAYVQTSKIPINKSTDSIADVSMQEFILPYKLQLEDKMNVVIGRATQDLKVRAPESLLSNFSADVYLKVAEEKIGSYIDISIVNIKGLRSNISAGDIKVSDIFELMPFENELVVLWIKGAELAQLFDFFASIGGEGVSGMQMGIKGGRAINVTVGGNPLDLNKTYIIATNDYLSEGNDGMIQLKNSEKRLNTGVKVRDMLIDYIQNETKQGRAINPMLDGRIYVVKQ